jgi:hypothetical protein
MTTFVNGASQPFTVTSADGLATKVYNVTVNILDAAITTPVDSSLVFATTDELGASGLPATVKFNIEGGGAPVDAPVAWNNATFTAYATVAVTGVATFNGTSKPVTAQAEVIKKGTAYWVSSGSASTGLEIYDAVKAFAGSTLVNQVADKAYSADSWGYRQGTGSTTSARNISPTAYGSAGYDVSKWAAFLGGAANVAGNNYEYLLPGVPAGTYAIAVGNAESWNTSGRTMNNSVWLASSPRADALWQSATVNYANNAQRTTTGTFTLSEQADIIVRFTAVSGSAPCVAWFTISNPDLAPADGNQIVSVNANFNKAFYVQDATYANMASSLAPTAQATLASGKAVSGMIAWAADDAVPAQSKAYDTVTVPGVFTDPETGNTYPVSANFEVVPRGLAYFIDANSQVAVGGIKAAGSVAFDSVKALLGASLLNETSDKARAGDASTWGYTTAVGTTGATMRSAVNEDLSWYKVDNYTDKYNTGWFSHNTANAVPLAYSLDLPAGSYMLTAGIQEFWPSSADTHTRPYTITVSDGSATLSSAANALVTPPGQASGNRNADTLFFSLVEAATVTVSMAKTSGESGEEPQISWLAVARQGFYATPAAPAKDGAALTVGALLENYQPDATVGFGKLAAYDGSGKLAAVSAGGGFDVAPGAIGTIAPTLANAGTGSAKLFVWDSAYRPLTNAFSVPLG